MTRANIWHEQLSPDLSKMVFVVKSGQTWTKRPTRGRAFPPLYFQVTNAWLCVPLTTTFDFLLAIELIFTLYWHWHIRRQSWWRISFSFSIFIHLAVTVSRQIFWPQYHSPILGHVMKSTGNVLSDSSLVLEVKCSAAVERKNTICWTSKYDFCLAGSQEKLVLYKSTNQLRHWFQEKRYASLDL